MSDSEDDLKKALEQSIEESFKQIKDKYKESNDVSTESDNESIWQGRCKDRKTISWFVKNHDWYSEYSDDQRVWEKGSEEYQKIIKMAEQIDTDYSIFNEYAPDEYKRSV